MTGNQCAELPLRGYLLINLWTGLLVFAAFGAVVKALVAAE